MTGTARIWDIRPAQLADVPRLKELGVLGWETTYGHIVRPENRARYLAGGFWSHDTLSGVVSNPACLTLAAATDDSVLGFLTVEPAQPGSVELTRFYVDPTLRRSGIGSALFGAALDWSRAQAARSMIVNVFADNTVGCAFYERAGFRLTRLCPTTVGDQIVRDAWYELELGQH
jgi:ribosomal protein S18 acetylase RimI-like enzyme